jgi:type I restriction enzyme M protein
VETAPPFIAKIHKPGKAEADSMHGRYETIVEDKRCVVEYEPNTKLRDTEQIRLTLIC